MANVLHRGQQCGRVVRRNFSTSFPRIDFRSDTVTRPTRAMRKAMADAVVGDDVFGDDPTVIELQERCASLLGKEAAVYVPSGVMANQIALGCHGQRPGTATICGSQSHIYCYETGGASQLWGITLDTIENERNGQLNTEKIEQSIRPIDVHCPVTTCVALEQTQNKCGGTTLGNSIVEVREYMSAVSKICKSYGLAFHVDGARLLNAAAALDSEPSKLVEPCDTVALCLSKGVGAPVGSILAGSHDLIEEALRLRKLLGGGMRQSGVLCAAAMVGLDGYHEAFLKDHKNAKRLCAALNSIDGFAVEEDLVQSNLVFCDIEKSLVDTDRLKSDLEEDGIILPGDKYGGKHPTLQNIRFVLHRDLSTEDVDYAVEKIAAKAKS
jgi:threonine aldolase